MDDLMQFLRDRLDEDESVARTAGGGSTDGLRWLDHGSESGLVSDDAGMMVTHKPSTDDEHAAHIARHDPARVLREVEAKRQIIDRHQPGTTEHVDGDVCMVCEVRGDGPYYPCATVRLLALPYVDHPDHPDYRDPWRP
ncbi:DUF6221 family protein [Streptomyces sp. NPDC056255]|uniref:DUF6221 family protein n=1 Tax=Streptomyces sp. NPDC056255 TaxID=3345764 RepID=UPI0035DF6253